MTPSSLAAYRALVVAPQVKALAAAAGVLLVFGTVKDAEADNPSVDHVSAMRAVAIADFQSVGGMPSATNLPHQRTSNFIYSPETGSREKFALRARVLFNDKPHFIIGQISAG